MAQSNIQQQKTEDAPAPVVVFAFVAPPGAGKSTITELAQLHLCGGCSVRKCGIDDFGPLYRAMLATRKHSRDRARAKQWDAYGKAIERMEWPAWEHPQRRVLILDTFYGKERSRGYLRDRLAALSARVGDISLVWVVPREMRTAPAALAAVAAEAISLRDPRLRSAGPADVAATIWHTLHAEPPRENQRLPGWDKFPFLTEKIIEYAALRDELPLFSNEEARELHDKIVQNVGKPKALINEVAAKKCIPVGARLATLRNNSHEVVEKMLQATRCDT